VAGQIAGPDENDVWEECKTEDGEIYYWNVVTDETTWEKPEGMP